jgi:ABC-2 type transport system ATP-binding protein
VSAAVEATGLGKRYRRTWALRDCTLAIPQGRIAALVGPNGAGKTTLLHLAVGLLAPTAGAIRVLGQTPGRDPDLLGRVGFVAQDAPLYGDLNGAEHLRLGVELNRRFDQTLARDRLERLGVPLDRRVDRLSGGQRAQVALAMALAKRPELLLLDEPVASLDPLARREFLQALMGSVAEQGLTVVLSSHLLADLERVCDYLIVLQAARVQLLGSVDELLERHKLLVGPRRDPARVSGVAAVVRATHTDRQSTLLVRTDGPGRDPALAVEDVTLEDLVLAYLADPSAGALPGPTAAPAHDRLGAQA